MAYKNVEDRRRYAREYHAKRMLEDTQYAANFRAKKNKYRKERYKSDPEFRGRLKAFAKKEGSKESSKHAQNLRVRERRAAGLVWPSTTTHSLWARHIKHKYKMSLEQYEQKLAEQSGKCAICVGDNGGRKLFVDHDHSKPKGEGNRWLLCGGCNTMIGHAKESPAILRKAADMLELYHGA